MTIKKVRKQKSTLKSRAKDRGKRGVPVQKQKQVQNVNQKVIVRIGDVSKKKSRRRRTARKPKEQSDNSMMQSLQPNVIYQSYKPEQTASQQPTIQNLPLSPAPTATNMVPETVKQPAARGAFQDVGVGTEGFVTILEKQTKKEQQEELITPVKKPLPVPSTGELPSWIKDTQVNPAFVRPAFVTPTFHKPKEEPSSPFVITPIKPSVDSPHSITSNSEPPFTPSGFNTEPSIDVEKELTQIANFIHNAAYPIGRPVEGPSTTEDLPVQQSQPENFSSTLKHMSDVTSNWDTKQMMKILDKKGQALERKQMGIEDVRSVKLGASQFNYTPEPTFFQKLQKLPIIPLPDIPETEIMGRSPKEKKSTKVGAKNPLKKILTEEQRLMRNAKARATRASKKEQQQTVAIY